jgi:hypothetical protein
MAQYKCNSCGAIYSDVQRDGAAYMHACPTEIVTHATFDKVGTKLTDEKREPFANPRNENTHPNLQYHEGKPVHVSRDVNDATRTVIIPAPTLIIAEGAGRTLIEA